MKFKDKLQIQRKQNNLSQEQLAEKMGVSRQSISKWESGSTYPDMEKIIELTKILNCTLEDLLDDGTMGKKKETKNDYKDYIDDFLKYISNLYNMFIAMSGKQKITFIFEMSFITIMLLIAIVIIRALVSTIVYTVFDLIPILNFYAVQNLFVVLISTASIIISVMIWFHLLKIRYLNYYSVIEDESITKKIIEEEVDKKEKDSTMKNTKSAKKETIIIRDVKDKNYSFFNIFKTIINFIGKFVAMSIAMVGLATFLGLIIAAIISFSFINYHILFVFVGISFIALIIANLAMIKVLINYIFNVKTIKSLWISIILISILTFGIGIGFTAVSITNLEIINNNLNLETKTTEKELSKEILYNQIYRQINYNDEVTYNYTGTDNLIPIEFKINKNKKIPTVIVESNFKLEIDDKGYIYKQFNYKDLLEDLKEGKIRTYYYDDILNITIELSQADYNYIKSN